MPSDPATAVPATAPRSVYIETFGCQMNQADTEVVLARLDAVGYRPVGSWAEADLVLFNTCSVRDHAEAKVRSRLGLMRIEKQRRPDLVVGVMGCMAQREQAELARKHPYLDLVVGTDQFVHLPQLLERRRDQRQVVATAFGDFEDRVWDARREPGVNAWVPVMRGCNYTCTYCVVPATRGREKSRPIPLIEEEVRRLVDQGFRQVTLLGQTVDAYGKTLGDGTSLAKLLRRLHEIPGLLRLRFVTSHPKDITDELLRTMAELPRVARHLHVPAQAGCDRILRLMGRRYGRDEYLRLADRARSLVPGIELLSDFIVGFPTETEAEFEQTVNLMERVRFDGAYVFMYSTRPGTPALRLADDVPEAEKNRRCNRLLALQLAHQREQHERLHGQVLEVLVEGPSRSDPGMLNGRSLGNRNVMLPLPPGQDLVGRVVPVRIERSTALTLFGSEAR